MALLVGLTGIFLIVLTCQVIYKWLLRERILMDIPGPSGWPLIGNIVQMDPVHLHKTLSEWSMKYGRIFKIKIFQDNAVVLNDYESIREMLYSKACASRPYLFRFNEVAYKDISNVGYQNYSPDWNDKKKALTRSLNVYGAGLMKIESYAAECIDKLIENISIDSGNFKKSIDLGPHIHRCTAGILTTLYFGRKLNETELNELLEFEGGLMKLFVPTGLISALDFFPWMRYLPVKRIQMPIKAVEHFRQWVQERHAEDITYSEGDEQGILASLRAHVKKTSSRLMGTDELEGLTTDVIMGKLCTPSISLYSLILVLINFPNIQEKMFKEIQEVTKGRRPAISDRSKMKYIKAVMEENLRYSTIQPVGIPHFSEEDTSIGGKRIPRGTILLANFWALHHDEQCYDEAWKFKPERFLTPDGQMVPSNDPVYTHSMPFGAGRRVCPGESISRNRTFLTIASLLQKYKFLPEDPENVPSCDPRTFNTGVLMKPFNFKVKVEERQIM